MRIVDLAFHDSFTVPVVTPFSGTESYLKPHVSARVELESENETLAEVERRVRPVLRWLALRTAYLDFLLIRELQEADNLEVYFEEFFAKQPECPEISAP